MPRFSKFHVLYSDAPGAPRKYRHIAACPSEDGTFYEVHIFEGDSIQRDPDFKAEVTGHEYYIHPTLESAEKDADDEKNRSLSSGWQLQNPLNR
ncbi:MAG TPA: hypothetical protein VK716_09945 [Terracidiphilus sp.]|jgi:hypothetical protein|nr:hypothetical protein [Terracidiphilus sp.]